MENAQRFVEMLKDVLCLSLSPWVLKCSSIPRTVIFQPPTPTVSNATHRKMAGHVCEMALARATLAHTPSRLFRSFLILLFFRSWNSDGPDPRAACNFSLIGPGDFVDRVSFFSPLPNSLNEFVTKLGYEEFYD